MGLSHHLAKPSQIFLVTLVTLIAFIPHAAAQPRPTDAFQGCQDARAAPQKTAHNTLKPSNSDRVKRRAFASLPVMQAAGNTPDTLAGQCWFRVDGVWTDNKKVTIDRSAAPRGWSSDSPELITLAIGTYTRPGTIMIAPSKNSNKSLVVFDPLDASR